MTILALLCSMASHEDELLEDDPAAQLHMDNAHGGEDGMGDPDGDKPLTSQFRGVCWNKKNRRWAGRPRQGSGSEQILHAAAHRHACVTGTACPLPLCMSSPIAPSTGAAPLYWRVLVISYLPLNLFLIPCPVSQVAGGHQQQWEIYM